MNFPDPNLQHQYIKNPKYPFLVVSFYNRTVPATHLSYVTETVNDQVILKAGVISFTDIKTAKDIQTPYLGCQIRPATNEDWQ